MVILWLLELMCFATEELSGWLYFKCLASMDLRIYPIYDPLHS